MLQFDQKENRAQAFRHVGHGAAAPDFRQIAALTVFRHDTDKSVELLRGDAVGAQDGLCGGKDLVCVHRCAAAQADHIRALRDLRVDGNIELEHGAKNGIDEFRQRHALQVERHALFAAFFQVGRRRRIASTIFFGSSRRRRLIEGGTPIFVHLPVYNGFVRFVPFFDGQRRTDERGFGAAGQKQAGNKRQIRRTPRRNAVR